MARTLSRTGSTAIRTLVAVSSSVALSAGIWATQHSSSQVAPKKPKIEFNRDVRPILDKCSACHGHDPKAIQAGLRLDKREGATKLLEDGNRAIVPGHPEQSELINRINAKDKDSLMPPPSSNKVLTPDEKEVLKEWIVEGAVYKPHWAFVKPVRPTAPAVRDQKWPVNPIDNFVLAKLEENGLKPTPEADKRTLIRRVSLDLTGLDPTAREVANFLADKSPNAYEKVVDRLLASPRYGERMAMDWMDYARYADSNGYQSDWQRFQYRWRDWVIDAYNKNMPYDEFTIEQLAGDLLPHPTLDQIIATGFNRNHRINTEGGVIPEEWRIETVIDRVETTSAVWLGLTAGCARCHDHKYDPISQKEFYSLCSYFNNVPETGSGVEQPVNHPPFVKAPYPSQEREMTRLTAQVEALQKQVDAKIEANISASQSWQLSQGGLPASCDDGLLARYKLGEKPTVEGATLPTPVNVGPVKTDVGRSTGAFQTNDKSYVQLGDVANFDWKDKFSFGAWLKPDGDSGSPISRMDSDHDFRGWDMMLQGGRPAFHLINKWPDNALKVISKTALPMGQWSHVIVTYDGSASPSGVRIYVDGDSTEKDVEANSLSATTKSGVGARIGRRTETSEFSGLVDDVVIYNRVLAADEVRAMASISPAKPILEIPLAKRTADQNKLVSRYWSLAHDADFARLDSDRATVAKEKENLDSKITTVMVMAEMPKPRPCFTLIRGQYDHPGDPVTAGIPKVFPPLPAGVPNNRLGLAKWIVSPDNPLTARVTVNRMWERLFGTGIVETTEDFGTRSEFPSHPELLDWLATEMLRQKWDLKAMWKEMVMSRTYRQGSRIDPRIAKLDPKNRLISHGPRFRLPAEVLRDQAMQAAGVLVEKVGGPPVRPYQPEGIWDDVSVYGNLHNYKHDIGDDLHRRSLYTIWKRTAAPPEMTLFDVPGRETCRVRRARTDTPLQALVLLNDVTYLEAARGLATRMLEHGGANAANRLAYGYESLLARDPSKQEIAVLSAGIDKRLARYRANPKAAEKLVTIGDLPNDPKIDKPTLAAYTIAASTMLNLDETLTKE